MSHTCLARGCNDRCKPDHLMCGDCWSQVPKDLRHEVYRTYRSGKRNEWAKAAMEAVRSIGKK